MHLTLVLLAVLHLQPLNRKLSQIAWVYFLQTSVLTHGYKVCFTIVAPVNSKVHHALTA